MRRLLDQKLAERVCVYSRGEHSQALMRDEFKHDERLRWFIGDVRDIHRLRRAMAGCDVVVHAAALKRIEVGFYCPDEMVKTNVIGAMNVVEAASQAGVSKVIGLSTDKAWGGGVSPYGQTKALAESLFLSADSMFSGPRYAVVRYGNIWRSNGSVVPKWLKAKEAGEIHVKVTDPDCTRFFLRIEGAVQLVLDTIKTMEGGELIIPEDLPAYRVGDLVEAMGLRAHVTGLPAWERKHEGMRDGLTSDIARRLTVEDLRLELRRDEERGFDEVWPVGNVGVSRPLQVA